MAKLPAQSLWSVLLLVASLDCQPRLAFRVDVRGPKATSCKLCDTGTESALRVLTHLTVSQGRHGLRQDAGVPAAAAQLLLGQAEKADLRCVFV